MIFFLIHLSSRIECIIIYYHIPFSQIYVVYTKIWDCDLRPAAHAVSKHMKLIKQKKVDVYLHLPDMHMLISRIGGEDKSVLSSALNFNFPENGSTFHVL